MPKKRKWNLTPGLIFGWLGLLVAAGFFALRADETGDQLVDLFLRNQIHVESSVQSVQSQSQLLKSAMRASISQDTTGMLIGIQDTLQDLTQQTTNMLADLNGYLNHLDSLGGRVPGTHEYTRAGETGGNLSYWEQNKSSLEQQLQTYAQYLEQWDLADQYAHWKTLPVEGPVAANIAMLQGIKLEVLQAERRVLDKLNEHLGVADYQTNRLVTWAMPKTESALVGMPYEIRLGLLTTTDVIQPTFISDQGRFSMMKIYPPLRPSPCFLQQMPSSLVRIRVFNAMQQIFKFPIPKVDMT